MLARLPATKWSGHSGVDGIPPRTLRNFGFHRGLDHALASSQRQVNLFSTARATDRVSADPI